MVVTSTLVLLVSMTLRFYKYKYEIELDWTICKTLVGATGMSPGVGGISLRTTKIQKTQKQKLQNAAKKFRSRRRFK